MSSFDVKNYPGIYNIYLPVGPEPAIPPPTFSATPMFSMHGRGIHVQAPFVYLPDGSYTTADKLSFPPPKQKFVGATKHARLKNTIINGERISYYEYSRKCGHECQLEVVGAPSYMEKRLCKPFKRSSSEKARSAAEQDLKNLVQDAIATHQASTTNPKPSATTPPQTTEATLVAAMENLSLSSTHENPDNISTTATPNQSDIVEPSHELRPDPNPDRPDIVDPPSETELRKEQIEKDLKDGIKSGLKASKEKPDEDLENDAPKEASEADPKPSDKTSSNTSGQETFFRQSLDKLSSTVKKVECAADKSLALGRKQAATGETQLAKAAHCDKVAEILDQKLAAKDGKPITVKKSDGKEVTLTREQAKQCLEYARQQSTLQRHTGMDNLARGKATASTSHGVKSGAKKLGKDLGTIDKIGSQALGANLGGATVDFFIQQDFSLEATTRAAKGVGVSTVKGVAVQLAENTARSAIKGAVKELAPQIAKKIPGVSTLNSVYSVGNAVLSANTVEEAFDRGLKAGIDVAIGYGCTAIGTAIIPIPFLGSFVGAALGSLVIHGKNYVYPS